MSMGAVLYRVGTVKGSELGGLYKSMPLTTVFCIIGAASISGFPLFSGFVSKAMIVSAAGQGAYMLTWVTLLFASAGVFHHSGIKIPYFAFFGHDSGKRCAEAPANMLLAMGIAAAFCIGIGIAPAYLYAILPYPVAYAPYSVSHVLAQMQLLMFSALAFSILMWTHVYPPEMRRLNLDVDWLWRGAGLYCVRKARRLWQSACAVLLDLFTSLGQAVYSLIKRQRQPDGLLLRAWPTASMSLGVMLMLFVYLAFYYLGR